MKTGTQLKLEGIERVSLYREGWINAARQLARASVRFHGTVTTDDLHRRIDEPPHPNCWGVVLRHKDFEWTGRYVTSQRPEAHGRPIKVWKLKEQA